MIITQRTITPGFILPIVTFILTILPAALPATAQTYSVLHSFSGVADGYFPSATLTLDRAGNLYGTASVGGSTNCSNDQFYGCGTVFKLTRHGSSWIFNVLYAFQSPGDGEYPETAVVFGPNGSLYGTTAEGGGTGCFLGEGCGTVFQLQPPASFCSSVSCPWAKNTIYEFTGLSDGGLPQGNTTFDPAGNMYGTTQYTGVGSPSATVYELSPSGRNWNLSIPYSFPDDGRAATPEDGVVFDAQGNMWATTYYGGLNQCGPAGEGESCGVLFKLTPSGSGWTGTIVYQFNRAVGGAPTGNLIFDAAGNIYGTLQENGPNGGGSIYQYNPSTGLITVLFSLPAYGNQIGPTGNLVMDGSGNLYGVTQSAGIHSQGSIFKLTPSNGTWTYTDLHDFSGGSDGSYPYVGLVMDAGGNLYGTTTDGGGSGNCFAGCGTVFEVTP